MFCGNAGNVEHVRWHLCKEMLLVKILCQNRGNRKQIGLSHRDGVGGMGRIEGISLFRVKPHE